MELFTMQTVKRISALLTIVCVLDVGYAQHTDVRVARAINKYVCELPPQPPNGRWKLHRLHCADQEECDAQSGTTVLPLGSRLVYSCNAGYKMKGDTDVICGLGGNWLTIPVCAEIRCKGLSTKSVAATCKYKAERVECTNPVLPGTTASMQCKSGYKHDLNLPLNQGNNVICNDNGVWEPEPLRCFSECGVISAPLTPLIVGGFTANTAEFPWHASIYTNNSNSLDFTCGATIIQENLLITAASCTYDFFKKKFLDHSVLHIMTGNIYRIYDSPLHNNAVVKKAKVKNIYVECNYQDFKGNYAADIAILELVEPFALSASLLPACIGLSFNDLLVPGGDLIGKVAGFGYNKSGIYKLSPTLQSVTLPYVPYSQCRSESANLSSAHFITPDKFCAGNRNGSSICVGDSGGGLVFQSNGRSFLRGIVSVSIAANNHGPCTDQVYDVFTRLSKHIEWIREVIMSVNLNRPYTSCSNKF